MKLTILGMQSSGVHWHAVVFLRRDRLWRFINLNNKPLLALNPVAVDSALAYTRIILRETRELRPCISMIQLKRASSISRSSALHPAPHKHFFLDLPFFFQTRICLASTPNSLEAAIFYFLIAHSTAFSLKLMSNDLQDDILE